jgi:hypothetical protein
MASSTMAVSWSISPTFWTDTPASWFALAESRFRIRDITDKLARFDFLVSLLTKESVRLVLGLVETPPEENPYTPSRSAFYLPIS